MLQDEEILDFLKKCGSINRRLKTEKIEEFHTNLIEYNHGTAVQALEPLLPGTHPSSSSPDITYRVRALVSVCTQKISSDVTQTYLDKLNLQRILRRC